MIKMRMKTVTAEEDQQDYEFGWAAVAPAPDAGGQRGTTADTTDSALLNPAIIAMMVLFFIALLVLTYYKFLAKYFAACYSATSSEPADSQRDAFPPGTGISFYEWEDSAEEIWQQQTGFGRCSCSHGLDDSIIKSIPLLSFTQTNKKLLDTADCAVCLLEFQENEQLRILPRCGHAFHVACIDVWLRSHASCPICRANILSRDPNSGYAFLDESLVRRLSVTANPQAAESTLHSPPEADQSLAPKLTRSYSFGSATREPSQRQNSSCCDFLLTADMESPWRHRRSGSKWSKRFMIAAASPFNNPKAFFGLSSRALRSPFLWSANSRCSWNWSHHHRRRSMSPPVCSSVFSEHGVRRFQCMSSPPVFVKRFSSSSSSAHFCLNPSRLRAGDPEALLSPDRFNQRWR